jgi:hypothetical protein
MLSDQADEVIDLIRHIDESCMIHSVMHGLDEEKKVDKLSVAKRLFVDPGLRRPPVQPLFKVECDPRERQQDRHLDQRSNCRRECLVAVCAKDGDRDGDRELKIAASAGEGLGDGHLVAVLCVTASPEREPPEEEEGSCKQGCDQRQL